MERRTPVRSPGRKIHPNRIRRREGEGRVRPAPSARLGRTWSPEVLRASFGGGPRFLPSDDGGAAGALSIRRAFGEGTSVLQQDPFRHRGETGLPRRLQGGRGRPLSLRSRLGGPSGGI